MKRILIFIIPFLYLSILTCGQSDPVATSILDKFSDKALSAPAVSMEFELNIVDEVDKSSTRSDGKLVIMKNMFRLDIPDNIIWFNGSAVWTLAPEIEEVTISDPDTTDNTFLTNPEQIFTLYREGYKQRLLEETAEGSVIDLYPGTIDTEFIRIRLGISKSYDLVEAEYKRKDGYILFVTIRKYDLKTKYDNSYFSFDPGKFPNVDVIDMR